MPPTGGAAIYSSDLQLDPLQLCLHVLQFVSAVQHLLALLFPGVQKCSAETRADGLVSVFYLSSI